MPNQTVPTASKREILFYLAWLTAFFILLEISYFIQWNKMYLGDFTFVSKQIHIPLTILPAIIFFGFVQLLIHVFFCLAAWIIAIRIIADFSITKANELKVSIAIYFLCLSEVIFANLHFFPYSKFASLFACLIGYPLANIFFYLLSVITLITVLYVTFSYFRRYPWCLLFGLLFGISFANTKILPQKQYDLPNIFLIGIDSLRPDYLGFFGGNIKTPFLDSYLQQSAVFSQAVTPLARTFPSWTAILTGAYPLKNGVRFNLSNYEKINLVDPLPQQAKALGYETIYASDETRFSNISKAFGFDHLITPPMGLNDFLLGTFNDFPLSNLLVNTPIGKWLFPYSYANRPASPTYNPNTFVHLLDQKLLERQNKPLFLSVHFCLTHFPYVWSDAPIVDTVLQQYDASVARVDQQVADFFAILNKQHLLDNAIVILFSDHGEALELKGDRATSPGLYNEKSAYPMFYPPGLEEEAVDQSGGHGTDVLGITQYRILLAFRLYGYAKQLPGIYSLTVSTLDIKPTLLDLLNIKTVRTTGLSLAKLVKGEKSRPLADLKRHFFLESDYSPKSIRTVHPEMRDVLLEGVELFKIDPISLKLTVRDDMGQMIIDSKQYADLYGDWILALYPQSKSYRIPVLVNLKSGIWTTNLNSSFAKHSPAFTMLGELMSFYSKDLNHKQILLK